MLFLNFFLFVLFKVGSGCVTLIRKDRIIYGLNPEADALKMLLLESRDCCLLPMRAEFHDISFVFILFYRLWTVSPLIPEADSCRKLLIIFSEEGATVLVRPALQIVDCLNNQEFDTFVKHVEVITP